MKALWIESSVEFLIKTAELRSLMVSGTGLDLPPPLFEKIPIQISLSRWLQQEDASLEECYCIVA